METWLWESEGIFGVIMLLIPLRLFEYLKANFFFFHYNYPSTLVLHLKLPLAQNPIWNSLQLNHDNIFYPCRD